MQFLRLLALPLEGALVSTSAWMRSPTAIPRSALAPLGEAVRAALGGEVEAIEAACANRSMDDEASVAALGARLWLAAGVAVLPRAGGAWDRAGLPHDATGPIVDLAAALWRHGVALLAARRSACDGPPESVLRATLGPIVAEGPAALAAATVLLLREAAAPARVAWVAGGFAPVVVRLAEDALYDLLLAHATAVSSAPSLGEMADYAEALVSRLEDADDYGPPAGREERRRNMAAIRGETAAACRSRYEGGLLSDLLDAVTGLAGLPCRADDEAVRKLEDAARDLRRLEAAGRRLGECSAFDRARADITPRLLALAAGRSGLTRIELARVVEIIAGAQAALPLVTFDAES
ncbi:hypothetical protein ACLF3G_08465 [Falsiroseomonas sp. HC035]|uniref:hypothetical protein n=1 Tax=Falsiroseomonas sp. HC035 TaxID=3390999 RepID=UPI003D323079